MKKFIVPTLCAVMALSITANASSAFAMEDAKQQAVGQESPVIIGGDPRTWGPDSDEETGITIGMPSPFSEYSSLADAEKAAGFKLTLPEKMPEGYIQKSIETIQNDMIQVFYENGEKEILIRKAKGSDDISGDYNEYRENKKLTIGNLQVSTRGNDGKVSVVTWVDDEYTYSISVGFENEGLDTSVISDLISDISSTEGTNGAIGGDPRTWGPVESNN